MPNTRGTDRQSGVIKVVRESGKPGLVKLDRLVKVDRVVSDARSSGSRKAPQAVPAEAADRDDVEVIELDDSDFAFIELTDQVLAKARAVQRDPKRRRPSLRFR